MRRKRCHITEAEVGVTRFEDRERSPEPGDTGGPSKP